MKPRISAIIHTLNEESNIANAIRSVTPWVDEVLVIDMYSEDRTAEIARELGAKVFLHEKMGFVEPARAFAEEQASGEWIFVLDADELAPNALSRELMEIAQSNLADICYIPRLNYFGGFPLMNTGWGPRQDMLARFYRKGSLFYSDRIHSDSRQKLGSRVVSLKYRPGIAIIHFNYLNISQCIQKVNRYTDIEAAQMNRRDKGPHDLVILLSPVKEFLDRYLRKRGFLDGIDGLYYSFLMAFYKMTAVMKARESVRAGSVDDVRERYNDIARECILKYCDSIR